MGYSSVLFKKWICLYTVIPPFICMLFLPILYIHYFTNMFMCFSPFYVSIVSVVMVSYVRLVFKS
jgi:hypothetical protein